MSNVSVARKFEERIAALILGKRCSKKHYGHSTHDVESKVIIGECKLRESFALETWMQQVEEHWKVGKICVIFSKQKKLRDMKTIASMRITDFLELLREAGKMPICKCFKEGDCKDKDHDCPEGCCMYCEAYPNQCPNICKEGLRIAKKGR